MADMLSDTRDLIGRAGRGDEAARQQLPEQYRAYLRRMVEVRLDRRLALRVDSCRRCRVETAHSFGLIPGVFAYPRRKDHSSDRTPTPTLAPGGPMLYGLIFVMSIGLDFSFSLWTKSVVDRRTGAAMAWSGVFYAVSMLSTLIFINDPRMIPFSVAGHVIGTWAAMSSRLWKCPTPGEEFSQGPDPEFTPMKG